jgi:hypothetical protein
VEPSRGNFNVTTANSWQVRGPTPYLQSWNLTAEGDLGHESALELSYTGSKGTHLSRIYNLNQPFRSAQTTPDFSVPYPGWGTINYYGFSINSIYNAGTVTFRRRFARNLFYRAQLRAREIDPQRFAARHVGTSPERGVRGAGRSDWSGVVPTGTSDTRSRRRSRSMRTWARRSGRTVGFVPIRHVRARHSGSPRRDSVQSLLQP